MSFADPIGRRAVDGPSRRALLVSSTAQASVSLLCLNSDITLLEMDPKGRFVLQKSDVINR